MYIKLKGKKNSLTLSNDGGRLFFSFWNERGEIEYSPSRGWSHKRWAMPLPF